jgi:benzylsuccinate CoA-transferase BbsF subunit
MIQGGALGARLVGALFNWMREEGELPEWLSELDWASLDFAELAAEAAKAAPGQSTVDRVSDALARFFVRYTKETLYAEALRRGILLAPVNTVADIRADEQLAFREYFRPVDQGELGTIAQPGPWARLSGTPLRPTHRAPRIGEHTPEVLAELETPVPVPAPPRSPARAASPDALEGLKVWDMSWVGVGPMTARYLADYGATVVRLDSTKRPDVLRLGPPFKDGVPGINNSHFYGDFNASKIGVGIDVGNPLGRDVALRLVRWADVLVESFTPKTMAAWGLSYEELREVNPRLVMLSTCMQGQTGPRKDYAGYGNLMAAISGFYEVTGWPDREPTPVYGAYTDFICQRFTTTALVSAVDHQRRTGEGQHIDLAQLEAALQFLGVELLDCEANGRVVSRQGNRDVGMAPHGVYRCRDGVRGERWIAVAVEDDRQWRALQAAMGDPPWAADPALATVEGRLARQDELDERLAAWTADRDADEVFRLLQPRVAAGLVHDQTALHEDPQVVHRGYFVDLEHREQGLVPYDGMQAQLSGTPGRLRKAAPCVGEDTYEVLETILGMSEDEIADLLATEAVEIT